MKKIFTLIAVMFAFCAAQAQEKTHYMEMQIGEGETAMAKISNVDAITFKEVDFEEENVLVINGVPYLVDLGYISYSYEGESYSFYFSSTEILPANEQFGTFELDLDSEFFGKEIDLTNLDYGKSSNGWWTGFYTYNDAIDAWVADEVFKSGSTLSVNVDGGNVEVTLNAVLNSGDTVSMHYNGPLPVYEEEGGGPEMAPRKAKKNK